MNGQGNACWIGIIMTKQVGDQRVFSQIEHRSARRRTRISRFFREWLWLKVLIITSLLIVLIWSIISIITPVSSSFLFREETSELSNYFKSETGDTQMVVEIANIWEDKPVLLNKKLVALTFDDGPSGHTGRLLDILKNKGVRATFFALGSRASAFPELIRREAAEGHEVESHTMNHANLATLSASAIISEVQGAEDAICGILGKPGCIKYVRPPYGSINNTVRNIIKQPMMGWGIDSLDWKLRNSEQTKSEVLGHAFDGGIILMHDVYDTTVDAVEGIIDNLRADGYTFVTVDEMVQEREPNLATGVLHGIFKP